MEDRCCFCGKPFYPYTLPDRDVTGRVAHFTCSHSRWANGSWVSVPPPPMAEYDEGDDAREWIHLNGGRRPH